MIKLLIITLVAGCLVMFSPSHASSYGKAFKAASGGKITTGLASRSFRTSARYSGGSVRSGSFASKSGSGTLAPNTNITTAAHGTGSFSPVRHFNSSGAQLNPTQHQSINRFMKKRPANARNITYHKLPNGGVAVQSTSPARNRGYSKVYEKQIDSNGKKVDFTKTVYGPNGEILKVN